jgi:hypothetical protein
MKDGKIILHIEAGQVEAIAIAASLDSTYADLFEAARKDLAADPEGITPGVRVVVFGSFLIEAVCNTTLREMLLLEIKEPLAPKSVWQVLRRSSIHEKVSLIEAFASGLPVPARQPASELRSLFDLRNRLAHFRDDPTVVGGPIEELTKEVLEERLGQIPDHELVRELRPDQVGYRIEAIEQAKAWFEAVQVAHHAKHGIKSERIKADA